MLFNITSFCLLTENKMSMAQESLKLPMIGFGFLVTCVDTSDQNIWSRTARKNVYCRCVSNGNFSYLTWSFYNVVYSHFKGEIVDHLSFKTNLVTMRWKLAACCSKWHKNWPANTSVQTIAILTDYDQIDVSWQKSCLLLQYTIN